MADTQEGKLQEVRIKLDPPVLSDDFGYADLTGAIEEALMEGGDTEKVYAIHEILLQVEETKEVRHYEEPDASQNAE